MHALIFDEKDADIEYEQLEPGVEYTISCPKYIIVKTDDGRLVPIPSEKITMYLDASNTKSSGFKRLAHKCTTACCLTYHKIQGKTLGGVVLVMGYEERGKRPTLQTLLVGLSRVKTGADLKVWPMPSAQFEELKKLERDKELRIWIKSYTRDGTYDPTEAKREKDKLKREAIAELKKIDKVEDLNGDQVKKLIEKLDVKPGKKSSMHAMRALLKGLKRRFLR